MPITANSLPIRLIIASLLSVLLINFGDALIFDRIFFAVLVLATIISFPINKDTFSILAVVCLFFGFEELNWYITENFVTDPTSVWLKLYCYGLCITGSILERYEKIGLAVGVVVLIALGFEIYWIYYDLRGLDIYWYVLTSGIALLTKHVLLFRPLILHNKFPDVPDWTFSRMDQDFELFLKILLVIEAVMISEHLLRFLLDNRSILFVYQGYPYLAHGINLYLLLSAFLEIRRNYIHKHLPA